MKQNLWICAFAFLFLTPGAQAIQITESFVDNVRFDSVNSTGVWNHVLHYIHPPVWVDRTTGGADVFNAVDQVDLGDGRHGAFNTTTFSLVGSVSGSVITVDTNTFTALQFTTFDLPSGWTLRGSGARPLIIRVMGTMNIAGTIDCRGDNGTAGSTSSAIPTGGTGRCGGGIGGRGSTGANSADGTSSTAGGSGVGTAGGDNAGDPRSGGGGGGNSSSSGSPGVGSGAGGAAGAGALDSYLDTFTYGAGSGGAGGGGGGYDTVGLISGGGGGAGGGIIRIFAGSNVTLSGSIVTTGGNGGNSPEAGGGGGAGGIVTLFTPGSITGGGTINALGGTGGVGARNGGAGGPGNTWIAFGGTGSFSDNPTFDGPDPGETLYRSNSSYVVLSTPQDTRNSSPNYTAFLTENYLPGTSSLNFQVAGSNDGFLRDDTGWKSPWDTYPLQGKRWYRYKITFTYIPAAAQTSPIPVPLKVTAVTSQFAGHQQTEFNFTPACGRLGSAGEFALVLLLCYFGGLFTTGRLRIKIPFRHPKKISPTSPLS